MICLISLGFVTCAGDIPRNGNKDQGYSGRDTGHKDVRKIADSKRPTADLGKRVEAGSYAPCGPNSSCADGYACDSGTNECRPICTPLTPSCNQQVSPCKANESCLYISSFSAVCAPAKSTEGQQCIPGTGPNCTAGNICMDDSTCHRVCQIGSSKIGTCPSTAPYCTPVGGGYDGCWVCTKN